MYRDEVPAIVEYVKERGLDGLISVGAFVLCTIQMPLSRVLEQTKDIKQKGAESEALWGGKRKGYLTLVEQAERLHEALVVSPVPLIEALDVTTELPSFGLPKASFLLQCLGYDTACLDVHNLRRLGLTPNVTKLGKVKKETKEKKMNFYLDLVQQKGSEYWWDSWCEHVAGNRMNKTLPTAQDVSEYHLTAIKAE